ncbi:MAG: DUF2809 domain-containing protein [Lachnospirales bacterium]
MKKYNIRVNYLIIFLILLAIEIFIGVYVRDTFIRPYVGDMLIVILLYFGVRIFIPHKVKKLPIYIFAFAFFVEAIQLIDITAFIPFLNTPFFRIILGSTFDIADIFAYGAGTLVLIFYDYKKSCMEV